MKEALFILAVLLVLAALTAYRYRRQISAVLEFIHQVKAIREGIKKPQGTDRGGAGIKGPAC